MPLFPRYDGPPLIEQLCSVENLTLAWRRVRSNIRLAWRNRSAGVDAVTIRDFEADWARQMAQLADELRSGAYRPLPARHVAIPKPGGGERAIAILAVRDRIAQRAMQQVLEPLFEPLFLDCSYGCRPGVGVPEALAQVERYASLGLTWVVDADVAAYFDSIDHRILMSLLRQRIDEVAVLRLIARWLEAGAMTLPEQGPLVEKPASLIVRGGQVLRRALTWDAGQPPSTPLELHDPYAAARWEQAASEEAPGNTPPSGHEGGLWAALALARPALNGARLALPYVKRLGGRRLALAGAVALGAVAAGELAARSLGSPSRGALQGGALSPLLANIYLHPFDLALSSQGLRLVRFMDDFVIMCASQAEAEQALELAGHQLAMLRLALNTEKTRVASYVEGLEFLGQALAPRRHGPRLGQGFKNFEEAHAALQRAAGSVKRRLKP